MSYFYFMFFDQVVCCFEAMPFDIINSSFACFHLEELKEYHNPEDLYIEHGTFLVIQGKGMFPSLSFFFCWQVEEAFFSMSCSKCK